MLSPLLRTASPLLLYWGDNGVINLEIREDDWRQMMGLCCYPSLCLVKDPNKIERSKEELVNQCECVPTGKAVVLEHSTGAGPSGRSV